MTYNQKLISQTLEIIELLEPGLRKTNGRYKTSWGMKTQEGLRAAIFNILAEIDAQYQRKAEACSMGSAKRNRQHINNERHNWGSHKAVRIKAIPERSS